VATPRPHDADAGGDPEVLQAKADLREEAWAALQDAGAARFPGARHRIPNFVGAEDAAERLRATDAWARAHVVKCNPDSPQWPVRQRALEDGKVVVMAVPRLAEDPPFLVLAPDRLAVSPREASSIKGAGRHGLPTAVEDLDPVDLVVQGCVAVDEDGARLGKGGGFADLEFAIAAAAGLLADDVVVATTVHDSQVVATGRIPLADHDVRLGLVATPTRTIRVPPGGSVAPAIHWDALTDDKVRAIPVLARLRAAEGPDDPQ
jgi:5-formyltetrahydrofolate cyclo-ligase